jgi:hypothetical protein
VPRITGIVGVVEGNNLFHDALEALSEAVSSANAGAILEKVLSELGVTPRLVQAVDLEAVLASGRLASALKHFADARAIESAIRRLSAALARAAV